MGIEYEWRNGVVGESREMFETKFPELKSAGQFIHSIINKPFMIYLVEYYLGQFDFEDFKISKTLNRNQLNELNEFISQICGIQIKCRNLYIKIIKMYNTLLCIRTTFSLSWVLSRLEFKIESYNSSLDGLSYNERVQTVQKGAHTRNKVDLFGMLSSSLLFGNVSKTELE